MKRAPDTEAGGGAAPRHPHPAIPSRRDPREAGSPSRLRRPTTRWEGLAEASRLAKITVLTHGGDARPIITRGGKHLRSRMLAFTTGTQQVVEGRGHRDLVVLNDVDADVLDFEAHPFLIEMMVGGALVAYYPDHIRLLRDGTIELIEVKRSPADLRDPVYLAKLAAVAEVARRVGWTFRVLFHNDIQGPFWRMPNARAIHMRRFLRLTRAEAEAIAAFAATGAPAPWAQLRAHLSPGERRRADAVVQCAIARGRAAIDLDQRITDATTVSPRPPAMPRRGIRI